MPETPRRPDEDAAAAAAEQHDWRGYYTALGQNPDAVFREEEPEDHGPSGAAYRMRGDQLRDFYTEMHGQRRPPAEIVNAATAKYLGERGKHEAWQLQGLTEAVILAPVARAKQLAAQDVWDQLEDMTDGQREKRSELRHRRRELLDDVVEYKRNLIDTIAHSDGKLDHDELESLMAKSTGHEKWVRRFLPEVTAAAAAYQYFKEKAGKEGSVEIASFDEMADHKMHLRVTLPGHEPFFVRALHQAKEPEGHVNFVSGNIMEVGLLDKELSGFSVDDEWRAVLDVQVKGALDDRFERSADVERVA